MSDGIASIEWPLKTLECWEVLRFRPFYHGSTRRHMGISARNSFFCGHHR